MPWVIKLSLSLFTVRQIIVCCFFPLCFRWRQETIRSEYELPEHSDVCSVQYFPCRHSINLSGSFPFIQCSHCRMTKNWSPFQTNKSVHLQNRFLNSTLVAPSTCAEKHCLCFPLQVLLYYFCLIVCLPPQTPLTLVKPIRLPRRYYRWEDC